MGVAILEQAMKGVPLIKMLMLCLFSFVLPIQSMYVLHTLAGNRTVEAREEPRMDRLFYM